MSFPWQTLHQPEQLDDIRRMSAVKPQIIFKHSTRCNISSLALRRLEQHANTQLADYHLLDLIAHRNLSNLVADTFDVWHESPQILLITDGACIFDESHLAIDADEINTMLTQK